MQVSFFVKEMKQIQKDEFLIITPIKKSRQSRVSTRSSCNEHLASFYLSVFIGFAPPDNNNNRHNDNSNNNISTCKP